MYKFLYLLHINGFWESLEVFSESVLQKLYYKFYWHKFLVKTVDEMF